MHDIRIYYFVGGGLSMLGTGLAIVTYLKARKYIRNELFEMLLRLMICDFVYSTKWILPSAMGHLGNHEHVDNWDCLYEAIVDSFFGMSTIMWYMFIAWRVYSQTKSFEVKRNEIPWRVHLAVWGVSSIVTVIPLSLHMVSEDALDTGTCMLMGEHSSLLFGIPLCLFILAALALLGHTVRLTCCPPVGTPQMKGGIPDSKHIFKAHSERGVGMRQAALAMARESNRERSILRLKKVSFYLIVFVIFWGSLVVVRIWRLARDDNTPLALEAVMALSLSIQGFVNSVLWLCDGSLRPWLCAGCCCCGGTCVPCCQLPTQITRNLSFGSLADDVPNVRYDRIASNDFGVRFLEGVLDARHIDVKDSDHKVSVGMTRTPPSEGRDSQRDAEQAEDPFIDSINVHSVER